MPFSVRRARCGDAPIILQFILELAEYEHAANSVLATEEHINRTLFGEVPDAYALLVEDGEGSPVGFAVYFFTYSTWRSQRGLFLEDLYIAPSQRGNGLGSAMLSTLAQIALEECCARFEWNVLDWNEAAIRVYRAAGALPQSEWTTYRVDGERLEALGQRTALPRQIEKR